MKGYPENHKCSFFFIMDNVQFQKHLSFNHNIPIEVKIKNGLYFFDSLKYPKQALSIKINVLPIIW